MTNRFYPHNLIQRKTFGFDCWAKFFTRLRGFVRCLLLSLGECNAHARSWWLNLTWTVEHAVCCLCAVGKNGQENYARKLHDLVKSLDNDEENKENKSKSVDKAVPDLSPSEKPTPIARPSKWKYYTNFNNRGNLRIWKNSSVLKKIVSRNER